MKYLHSFSVDSEFKNEYYGSEYAEPWVSLTEDNTESNYNKLPASKYLTFKLTANSGSIRWQQTGSTPQNKTISYSKDGTNWIDINSSAGTQISVSKGESVMFKGTNTTYATGVKPERNTSSTGETPGINLSFCYFKTSGNFNLEGNIMSLIGGDDFSNLVSLSSDYTFAGMFSGATVVDAGNLLLPAISLSIGCYCRMFMKCTNLNVIPSLPARIMKESCYEAMFRQCSGLVNQPELPATTMDVDCYNQMFMSTGLQSAPKLSAMNLAKRCYFEMFRQCAGLVDAPELPATTLTEGCYSRMFRVCTSLVMPPELPATKTAYCCYKDMFGGCTKLIDAPELPATGIPAGDCYRGMFSGCTALVNGPSVLLHTELDPENYNEYSAMFSGCTSLVNAPEIFLEKIATVDSLGRHHEHLANMFTGCKSMNYLKIHFIPYIENGQYKDMGDDDGGALRKWLGGSDTRVAHGMILSMPAPGYDYYIENGILTKYSEIYLRTEFVEEIY